MGKNGILKAKNYKKIIYYISINKKEAEIFSLFTLVNTN
jgi:hypothetical protein